MISFSVKRVLNPFYSLLGKTGFKPVLQRILGKTGFKPVLQRILGKTGFKPVLQFEIENFEIEK
ncbi:MAG: hypothetical protein BWK80_06820 [Desulfobacteraceae bacterium IS3]|nr:MAG: hypothetical protein BWK80_06820 [Desulfobacteraceae bacterium IS3]